MNKKLKILLYIAGFILFILIAVFGYNNLTKRYKAPNSSSQSQTSDLGTTVSSQPEEPKKEENRMAAPDFTVLDYDGNSVKLSDYIGTPIVLNFWASWCPPCKDEMPHFNKVSEEYPRGELLFLMVDLAEGSRETVEKGKKFVESNKYSFTVLFDTEQDAASTYGIRSIPSTLFLDRDGYIVGGVEGGIDEDTLRYGISLIIGE